MGRRLLVLGTLVCALAWPSAAMADKRIEAGPSNKYTTPEVTIDQGEKLTFVNNDVAGHDVTATDKGPDGKPLFNTPIVNRGESAFVEGSQYLTAGHYAFLCSVHTDMKGTIHVTGNGTPKPRPGQPGGPAAGEKDTQAPTLGVRLVRGRGFLDSDRANSPWVVIVDETFAARYLKRNPIGQRLRFVELGNHLAEVVGVSTASRHNSVFMPSQPFIYLPLAQHPASSLTLVAHTERAYDGRRFKGSRRTC